MGQVWYGAWQSGSVTCLDLSQVHWLMSDWGFSNCVQSASLSLVTHQFKHILLYFICFNLRKFETLSLRDTSVPHHMFGCSDWSNINSGAVTLLTNTLSTCYFGLLVNLRPTWVNVYRRLVLNWLLEVSYQWWTRTGKNSQVLTS